MESHIFFQYRPLCSTCNRSLLIYLDLSKCECDDDYDDVDDDDENGDGTDSKFTRGDSVSSTVRVTEMSEPLRSKAENIFQLLKFFSSNLRAPSWECLPCHSTLISILALSCGL